MLCSLAAAVESPLRNEQLAPDVALLDIDIVDLNLPYILSSIAADGLKTKVVCLAASASGRDLTGAIAMGAKGILFKDAEPDKGSWTASAMYFTAKVGSPPPPMRRPSKKWSGGGMTSILSELYPSASAKLRFSCAMGSPTNN